MQNNYWKKFYKKHKKQKETSFARFVLPFLDSEVIDLGCGTGRDWHYFVENGIIADGIDLATTGEDLMTYIRLNDSPQAVYTRFLWHAINRKEQLAILKWAREFLFIEARTTEDIKTKKIFGKHKRNYVNVPQIVRDLKRYGFQIRWMAEGRGYAKYKNEDPHIIRIVAKKYE